jgi:glycosyltransferase involved in cell wall biosynthesis
VVIAAYNEAPRIIPVLEQASQFAQELIVIDDASSDATARQAAAGGAKVIRNPTNRGQLASLATGSRAALGDIVVHLDADGEHDPADIPRLIEPIENDQADLVLGRRQHVPRPSERWLSALARLRVRVQDSGTGFRAMNRWLAKALSYDWKCVCGTLALAARRLGARITEVPIETCQVRKIRGIAWGHGRQLGHVLHEMLR